MIIAFMGTTHAPLGALFALLTQRVLLLFGLALPFSPGEAVLAAAVVGTLAGLWPDLDRSSSILANPARQLRGVAGSTLGVKRGSLVGWLFALPFGLVNIPFRLISQVIEGRLGHRGPLHSLGAGLAMSASYTLAVGCGRAVGLNLWLALMVAAICTLLVLLVTVLLTDILSGGLAFILTAAGLLLIASGAGWLQGSPAVLAALGRGQWLSASLHLIGQVTTTVIGYWGLGVCYFAGYVSHLLGDGCTKTSQPIFWPLAYVRQERGKKRRVQRIPLLPVKWWLLPKPLRVYASGLVNHVIGGVALLLVAGLLILSRW